MAHLSQPASPRKSSRCTHLLVAAALAATPTLTHAAIVVDWSGDYVTANTNYGRSVTAVSNDYLGAAGNTRVISWSESTPLNPSSGYTAPAGKSSTFYGGLFTSATGTSLGFQTFTANVINSTTADRLSYRSQINSSTALTRRDGALAIAFLKTDFLALSSSSLTIDSTSSLSLNINNITSPLAARFMVKEGSQWYVSNTSYTTSGLKTLSGTSLASETWAVFNPTSTTSSLVFSPGSFSVVSFSNITAVGYYANYTLATTSDIAARDFSISGFSADLAEVGSTPNFTFASPNNALTLNVLRGAGSATGSNIVLTNTGGSGTPSLSDGGSTDINATYAGGSVASNGTANVFVNATNTGSYTSATPQTATVTVTTSTGNNTSDITIIVGEASTGAGNTFGTPLVAITDASSSFEYASRTTAGSGRLGTQAIISGTNDDDSETVSLAWRTRKTSEIPGSGTAPLFSDVVQISGTDVAYLLKLYYNPGDLGDAPPNALLAGIELGDGIWGNAGGAYLKQFDTNWDQNNAGLSDDVGRWGIDTTNNYVWVVLNSGGTFAVIPEPTSLALLGLGAIGLLARRRHR